MASLDRLINLCIFSYFQVRRTIYSLKQTVVLVNNWRWVKTKYVSAQEKLESSHCMAYKLDKCFKKVKYKCPKVHFLRITFTLSACYLQK